MMKNKLIRGFLLFKYYSMLILYFVLIFTGWVFTGVPVLLKAAAAKTLKSLESTDHTLNKTFR
tara:strand:- start:2166 stop:2354 length:189 start_codon:yes stop_codon:yes gene_type:complete